MNKDYFNSQGLTGSDFHDALCIRKDAFHRLISLIFITL